MAPLTASFVTTVFNGLDTHGPATAGELAHALGCSYGPVKSALDSLADIAAVCRTADPQGAVMFWVPVDHPSSRGGS